MTSSHDPDQSEESEEILSQVSTFKESDSVAHRQGLAHRLMTNRDVAILAVTLALFAFFALIAPRFISEFTMIDISRRASILGILAVGMTFLFVAGELDLSIGSHYGFLLILMSYQNEQLAIDP